MNNPRTTAPSYTNKYFIHKDYGGLNECILIKGKSCLPNCVGYCWGATYELTGTRPKLSRRNAELWFGYTADGYKRGNTPKLNAIACYQGDTLDDGSDGAGHVGVVVGIDGNKITLAQSNYGGTRWEMKTYTDGKIPGLTLQGYIYVVDDEENNEGGTEEVTTETALKKMAEDVIAGKYGNGFNRKERLYKAIQAKVNELMR